MKTMYRIGRYETVIDALTVVKETEHFVWFQDSRWSFSEGHTRQERKDDSWFNTWAEAKAALVARAEARAEAARRALNHADENLLKVMTLKPPKETP